MRDRVIRRAQFPSERRIVRIFSILHRNVSRGARKLCSSIWVETERERGGKREREMEEEEDARARGDAR